MKIENVTKIQLHLLLIKRPCLNKEKDYGDGLV